MFDGVKAVVLVGLTYGLGWAILESTHSRSLTLLVLTCGIASIGFLTASYLSLAANCEERFGICLTS